MNLCSFERTKHFQHNMNKKLFENNPEIYSRTKQILRY